MIADQIRAFRLALETACAERIERSAHATGLFCDTIPNVYDLNFCVRTTLRPQSTSLTGKPTS